MVRRFANELAYKHPRIDGVAGHVAHVLLVARQAEVALIAPARAPRVLCQPVVLGTLSPIADNKNRVIRLATRTIRIDSRAILPIEQPIAVDRHGHRPHRAHHALQLRLVALGNANLARFVR